MNDWDLIESFLLGADDPEREELERSIPNDGPLIRAFQKSKRERLIIAFKYLPVVFGFVLTAPLWILYYEYEERILPIWWKITGWWELIQWQHEHMPVEQERPLTAKQKKELAVTGIVCGILLLIIIYLSYLMSKY